MNNHWTIVAGLAVAFGLTASAFAAAPPKPPVGLQETFQGCKWEEVRGRVLSIWSCNTTDLRLVADDRIPGFVVEQDGKGDRSRPAVRIFRKAAKAPLQSVLAAAKAASPGRYTPRCAFAPWPSVKEAKGRVALEPTGAPAKAWAASQRTSTMPDEPCGPLGVGYVGDRYFQAVRGDPTVVVFIDRGSEIQIFDSDTLRPAPKR